MSGPARGLPIPSFSTAANGIVDEELSNSKKQSILQLEAALQLHFTRTNTKSITYRAFSSLASKIQLDGHAAAGSGKESTTSQESAALLDLSKEDRLWHDLYCVAVPTLYSVSRQNGAVTLNEISVQCNRSRELRRLLDETSTMSGRYTDASKQALSFLNSVRSTGQSAQTDTSTGTESQAVSAVKAVIGDADAALVKPGMTLEERVRARSKKREADLQQAREAQENSFEDRLNVADQLYSHACHILRRQQVFGNKKGSDHPASTLCVLTFKDVVRAIPNRSRKDITRNMVKIAKVAPDWINWSHPKHKSNHVPIEKDATVWIETHNYKNVRALLAGEKVSDTEEGESEVPRTPMPQSAEVRAEQTLPSHTTRLQQAVAVPVVGTKKRNADDDISPTALKQQKKPPSAVHGASASGLVTVTPVANVQAVGIAQPGDAVAYPEPASKPTDPAPASPNKKRVLGDITPPSPSSPTSKKRRGLRTNPNFILCDADYDGGTIIEPSFDSPRGLKRLFNQMNAGQRI